MSEFTWDLFERVLATMPRPDPAIARRKAISREASARYRERNKGIEQTISYQEFVALAKGNENKD